MARLSVLLLTLLFLASCDGGSYKQSGDIAARGVTTAPPDAYTGQPQSHSQMNESKASDLRRVGDLEPTADSTSVSGESYNTIVENPFLSVSEKRLSTFSIDVDAAAYSNVRRFITDDMLPPPDAVRTEELINYFTYDYPEPGGDDPFSITTDVAAAPWNPGNRIVMVGLQGRHIQSEKLPPSNLVFLVDVSGSMNEPDRLPLVKKSLKMLVARLRREDNVSMVVYAGAAGLVLPPTSGAEKSKILSAIDRLEAGGSTAGGEGIVLAYRVARDNYFANGNNRVILATDGDFNVGVSDEAGLVSLIEKKREQGVFLTVMGFGTGNLQDSKMEQLADKGNGHYAYIDSDREGYKVLVQEMGATLHTIAKDVKIQVEFNPSLVSSYRLIGYENRLLRNEEFDDDTKDAGELGAGHSVTALYEIVPADGRPGRNRDLPRLDEPDADGERFEPASFRPDQMMAVKLRYKRPSENTSNLIIGPVITGNRSVESATENLRWASSVAEWCMILRGSKHMENSSHQSVIDRAQSALGADHEGYRKEFISLVQKSKGLRGVAYR